MHHITQEPLSAIKRAGVYKGSHDGGSPEGVTPGAIPTLIVNLTGNIATLTADLTGMIATLLEPLTATVRSLGANRTLAWSALRDASRTLDWSAAALTGASTRSIM